MRSLLVASVLLGCHHGGAPVAPPPLRIDHVILGVADLATGIPALEALTGATLVQGGVHPDGTANALLSLGPTTYLELLALGEGKVAPLAPVAYALAADDVARVQAMIAHTHLELGAPVAGGRVLPDGTTLHWSTLELVAPELGDLAPFFIHWDDPAQHPARTSPGGCALVAVDVTSPAATRLAALALPPELHLHVGPDALAITLRCGARTLHFPPA